MSVPKCVSWNLWCTSGGLQLKYGNLCSNKKKCNGVWAVLCQNLQGLCYPGHVVDCKGFPKGVKSISLSFTPVLQDIYDCIEKFKVHIMNLWTSSCPGPNTVFFWGCLFAAYRMFSIAVIHSFWPKLVLQMAGRPHPHVMLTYPTPEPYPKWFPCPINPINPIILRHEPTEFRKSTRSRAGCHGELRKYPCFIHV